MLSTGEPSTLKTYKKLATVFGGAAVDFVQKNIDNSEVGENEEVIADETQMIYILATMTKKKV